jgi:hypothetical protein
VTLGGSVDLDPFLGVSGAELFVTGGPFTVGGVTIGGNGCHSTLPGAPTIGPCVQVGWNVAQSPVPTVHVAGSVDVSGFGVGIDGFVDNTGFGFSGHIDLPVVPQASAVQVSGRFYAGHLAGLTATDLDGAHVAVQDGDFTLSAGTLQPITLGGISLSALVDAGHLGHGHDWVRGNASVNVLGGNASIGGTVSRGHDHSGNVQYSYDLTGSGAATLDGYLIAAGHVELSNNVLHIDGSLNIPHVTLSFGGNITESPLTYSFTGNLDVDMGFIHVSGTGSLSSAGVIGQLTASAYKFATISGTIWVANTGEACTGASASIGNVLSGSVNLCTPGAGGISARLNILGYQLQVPNLGSDLGFDLNWGGGCITSGTFDGYYLKACASAQFQYPNPFESLPGQGPLLATGSASGGYVESDGTFHGLSISYDLGKKEACGSFLTYSECVSF